MNPSDYERLATFEELDREPLGQEAAEHADEVAEHGEFGPDGGTLSDEDFADARANL